jgi:hypothetical protein
MKFIGTRDPKAERMGILGIQFYGYEKTLDEMEESETWVCVLCFFLIKLNSHVVKIFLLFI